MHMLFLCPFAKAAWFCKPWFIKSELLAAAYPSIPDMIRALLSSGHPQINTTNLYTFLWCLWKARNDTLFGRKMRYPSQVFAVFNAILQASNLETLIPHSDQTQVCTGQLSHPPEATIQDPFTLPGTLIFTDASWKQADDSQPSPAGIGVVIQVEQNQHFRQLHLSALSPPALSVLQAEAFALLLAIKLADVLQLQEVGFFTDSLLLVKAVSAGDCISETGHWVIRPQLAAIRASSSFQESRISHVQRSFNVKTDHHARLAVRIQDGSLAIRCLRRDEGHCPGRVLNALATLLPFRLLSVKCT
ncbi:unnamed protein product [Alopecurus aequalis]